jgi:DNA-binding MarR family transcriptional regulator
MGTAKKLEEAKKITLLLPALMRQLFTFEDDLAAELPLAQLRVCVLLNGGPRSMSLISKELGISLSAMTQLADRLENAKMVARVTQDGDRRVRCLELTQKGRKIICHREEARIQNVLTVLNNMSGSARVEVINALETLLAACLDVKAECTKNIGKNGSCQRSKKRDAVALISD